MTTMDHIIDSSVVDAVIVKKRSRGRPKREIPLTDEEQKRKQEKSLKDIMNKIMNAEDYKNNVITNGLNN